MIVESLDKFRIHHRSLQRARILVVDDEATIRAIHRQYLENAGFSVTEATSGEEAFQRLNFNQIDIMLLDISMPDMAGLEVLKAVRQKYSMSQLPIIMVTAKEESTDVVEALSLGANDYIVKPVAFAVLIARIKTHLSYKQAEDELREAREVLEHRVEERTAELLATNMSLEREISDRKRAEGELQNSEERFRTLYDNNPIMLFTVDEYGKILSVNEFGLDQLGYSKEQLVDKPVIDLFYEEDRLLAQEHLKQCFNEPNKVRSWELRKVRQNGSSLWVRETVRVVDDIDGKPNALIVCEDITRTRQLSEQLSHQASHDVLTDLVNRREFERRLERVLDSIKLEQSEHALCYMDLDQFKVVNDSCGHVAGDEMLRQLSKVLQKEIRKRDTLARLGGDEFGVLMEHCPLDQAQRVAGALQKVIQDFQFNWEGRLFRVGVSIGLVAITIETPNAMEILKRADAACYMAKDQGRNRIHVYRPDDEDIAKRHGEMQWVTRIHQALKENRFCLYAQPIVSLGKKGEKGVQHYELLLRMVDEEGKHILPGAFLPAAERYNVVTQIDRWVIESALTLLEAHPDFLRKIDYISINLSGQSLVELDMLDFIVEQLRAHKIQPVKVCFEITETAAIANLDMANRFISNLKERGCRFALDDFGSGLSSFGYLKNLNVDYLKIDGMFVKDMVDDAMDHAMVKSINEIGQVMGMKTIAEFVENDLITGMLKEIDVDYAQGYGIGKPQLFNALLG